ncbi:MAG TPA: hypothetical protein VFB14_19460 [Bryobacteraceae bacterium]|jgi:hypothetical protein|nr:hypothetical protein [Bryobacteraceae bacterium]
MALVIRRLEERDEVESFDCGDEPLNNYLKRHAWTNQQRNSIGATYVAVNDRAPKVLGYFNGGNGKRAARSISPKVCGAARR